MTTPDPIAALLDKAIGIIETADNRAMASDGPVGHVRDEMSDKEWRDLYVALTTARAALTPPTPTTSGAIMSEPRTEAGRRAFTLGEDIRYEDIVAIEREAALIPPTPEPPDGCGNCHHGKGDHSSRGAEKCGVPWCQCPGYLTRAASLAALTPPTPELDSDDRWRLVRMATDLPPQWVMRSDRGERVTVEWGSRYDDGTYDLKFTVHSENVLTPSVEALAEALPQHRTCSDDVSGHESCLRIARKQWANLRRGS